MKDAKRIHGILPPTLTGWTSNGEIDREKTKRHIQFVINGGVHGILVAGSTGEASLMTISQRKEIIDVGIEAAEGKVPVIAGTGHNSTKLAVELTRYAEASGAYAAMAFLPHYPKPIQEGLYNHYKALGESVNIPVFVYSWPGQYGIDIDPETVGRLAEEGYIQGIKDSTESLDHTLEIIRLTKGEIIVLNGVDSNALATLCLGAQGAMMMCADIVPGETVKIYNLFKAGKIEEAAKQQLALLPLFHLICAFGIDNLPVVREGAKTMGCDAGDSPSPSTKLNPHLRDKLGEELAKFKQ
jgi:4-hydroxy-tetrahydrodipicolinate synthase